MGVPARLSVSLISEQEIVDATTWEERLTHFPVFARAFDAIPLVDSYFVGYGDGDFFLIRKLETTELRQLFEADAEARYIVQSIDREDGAEDGRIIHLDAEGRVLRHNPQPDYPGSFDPRQRPWYSLALESDAWVRTDPYVFATTGILGITLARKSSRSATVVGVDFGLAHIWEAAAQAERDAAWQRLDDDFAFVGRCNKGGEFLGDEDIARLKAIAARTWTRTMDDRLGLSQDELSRKQEAAAQALPAEEPLLADRPDHIIARPENQVLDESNPWGFKMPQPEHLYNRGEQHNLAVSRGTLSDEERYKINDHIVQTIIMLSALPYPRHLRDVPELAGGHHEKMDGTGYPRRLTGAEMSPVARMMAIADIFEALTAADRPYKKGKPLSVAMKIMAGMAKEGHVDPELFDLFLTSGVFRRYAERFMDPAQIDEVKIEDYLATRAA